LNANSDFLDVTKAYWEGVLNGVTFGGADEYWQSRADRRSVVDSLAMGALRFGEGVFAVDEYKVERPTANNHRRPRPCPAWLPSTSGAG
jgi:hypothetical protein